MRHPHPDKILDLDTEHMIPVFEEEDIFNPDSSVPGKIALGDQNFNKGGADFRQCTRLKHKKNLIGIQLESIWLCFMSFRL